jgi:hypothetical protein
MYYFIVAYAAYLIVSILLTIYVARTLFRNGKVFLVDIFHGNRELADSVNNLLLVGFYLINIGYAVYTMQADEPVGNVQQAIEMLSLKLGRIILILGGMHFFNLFVFFKLRNRAKAEQQTAAYRRVEL